MGLDPFVLRERGDYGAFFEKGKKGLGVPQLGLWKGIGILSLGIFFRNFSVHKAN